MAAPPLYSLYKKRKKAAADFLLKIYIFSDDTKDESENNPTFKYIVDGLDNTVKQYLETITLQDVLEIENNYYSDNYVI